MQLPHSPRFTDHLISRKLQSKNCNNDDVHAETMSSSSSAAATVSSSCSPPLTPPSSPLPVSVGPGHQRYAFTPSPPSFSPPAETTSPLLPARVSRSEPRLLHYSPFSMDSFPREQPPCPPTRRFDLGAWCFEWILMLVCCCCSSSMAKFEK